MNSSLNSTPSLEAAELADALFDAVSDNDGFDDELELRERADDADRLGGIRLCECRLRGEQHRQEDSGRQLHGRAR
jgi:hypothetical protein